MDYIKEDIKDLQFAGNANLTYVSISENVNKIGEKAFAKCPNLIAIRIEESDNPIRISFDYVNGCKNLVEVSINRKVEFYKNYKIKGANKL